MTSKLEQLLEQHEGRVRRLYKCSAGFNTIGVGHNLDANPISDRAIDVILEDDLEQVFRQLDEWIPWWRGEDEVRRAALIDLTFNMGISGFMKFKNTLAAWVKRDYAGAAAGLEQSLWFTQVGRRGPRVVKMVRDGVWPS
jgi:lysozyme